MFGTFLKLLQYGCYVFISATSSSAKHTIGRFQSHFIASVLMRRGLCLLAFISEQWTNRVSNCYRRTILWQHHVLTFLALLFLLSAGSRAPFRCHSGRTKVASPSSSAIFSACFLQAFVRDANFASWCREWWKGDHAPACWREQDVIKCMSVVGMYNMYLVSI